MENPPARQISPRLVDRNTRSQAHSLRAAGRGFFILSQTTSISMFKNIPSFLAAAILLVLSANAARADIYQWEYIYPADPSQGKQQSLTVAPGGMSVVAQPGADLHSLDLTMAYLANQNLNGVNAQLANLTSAIFNNSNLTNANFTGAIVKGTD